MFAGLISLISGAVGLIVPPVADFGVEWLKMRKSAQLHGQQIDLMNATAEIDFKKQEVIASSQLAVAETKVTRENIKAANQVVGIVWVDALRGSLRPLVTYTFTVFYLGLISLILYASIYDNIHVIQAVQASGILAAIESTLTMILGFWFSSRHITKKISGGKN